MSLNFKIHEGESIDYDSIKKDYINGLVGKKLRAKYGIGDSQYLALLKRFREDGIDINKRGSISPITNPKYYHRSIINCNMYFIVKRTINGVLYYGGLFHTEAEAKQRVKELETIGWESCICSQ